MGKTPLEIRLTYQKKMRELRKGEKKKNKFNAKMARVKGVGFHSELEASVDGILRQRVAAGEIILLQRQDKITFYWNGVKIISYIPDFKCQLVATGEVFWVEAKGFKDALWSVKEACWRAAGPGRLEMWEGDARRPIFTGNIIPKAA